MVRIVRGVIRGTREGSPGLNRRKAIVVAAALASADLASFSPPCAPVPQKVLRCVPAYVVVPRAPLS